MAIRIMFVLALLFYYSLCYSQHQILDRSVNPGQVITEKRLPPPSKVGSYYINDDWYLGNVYMSDHATLKNYYLKYDIESNQLEIKVGNDIKVCNLGILNSFEWTSPSQAGYAKFINCNKFDFNKVKTPLAGVFEVIVDDTVKLLTRHSIKVVKSTYVATVDMGSKDDKIVKEETFYLCTGNVVQELSRNKKENLLLFGNHASAMDGFIKENGLSFKKRGDLAQIVVKYNALMGAIE